MIPSPEAIKLLKNAGCKVVKRNGQEVVKFPSRIVEDAIQSAPSRIQIFDRNGERAMSLEGKKSYFSTTGGTRMRKYLPKTYCSVFIGLWGVRINLRRIFNGYI